MHGLVLERTRFGAHVGPVAVDDDFVVGIDCVVGVDGVNGLGKAVHTRHQLVDILGGHLWAHEGEGGQVFDFPNVPTVGCFHWAYHTVL